MIQSRRHELLKVYTDSETAEDLLVLGQVTVGYNSGEKKRGEFTARIRLIGTKTSRPKVKLYKVWMVSWTELGGMLLSYEKILD